jgi:hypothetical protein
MAKNTVENVGSTKISVQDLQKEIDQLGAEFAKQPKVKVMIPKSFVKSVGSSLYVSINGAFINVPVGEMVEVPEIYAEMINNFIANQE